MGLKIRRLLVGAAFVVGIVAVPAADAFAATPGNGVATGPGGCGNPGGAFSVIAKIPGFSTAGLIRIFDDGSTPGGLFNQVCTPAGSRP